MDAQECSQLLPLAHPAIISSKTSISSSPSITSSSLDSAGSTT